MKRPALYLQSRLLQPLSPNAPRWSVASCFAVFGRSAPRSAAIDNRATAYTKQTYPKEISSPLISRAPCPLRGCLDTLVLDVSLVFGFHAQILRFSCGDFDSHRRSFWWWLFPHIWIILVGSLPTYESYLWWPFFSPMTTNQMVSLFPFMDHICGDFSSYRRWSIRCWLFSHRWVTNRAFSSRQWL